MSSPADDDRVPAPPFLPGATQRESAGIPRPEFGAASGGVVQAPGGDQWPFGKLLPFSYDLMMVDCPTEFKTRSVKGGAKSSQAQYGCMTLEELKAMPVGHLLGRHGVLFLWWTWPLLLYGGDPARHFADADASRSIAGELIRDWGLRYVTGGSWLKRTTHGKIAFGTGYRARSSCEPFLLAVTGNPDTSRAERNLIEGLRREHSRKPEEAFAWCERYLPGARRVELFSRRSRPGWDTWGYEAGKFDPVVTLQAAEPGTVSVFPPDEEGEEIDIEPEAAA